MRENKNGHRNVVVDVYLRFKDLTKCLMIAKSRHILSAAWTNFSIVMVDGFSFYASRLLITLSSWHF